MTIGPLKPNADSNAVEAGRKLWKSGVNKLNDHSSASHVRQSDLVELSLKSEGGKAPRATYSLDEIMSGFGQEISPTNSGGQTLSNDRLEQIKNKIKDGFYSRLEIIDEISNKIINRSQKK